MRPIRYDVVGVANGAAIPLDIYLAPFNVSLQIEVESGVIDATAQYTFDDIFDPDVTPDWVDHSDLTNIAADADATLISPVSAVRLINAGTGTARFNVIQAGATG